MDNEEFYKQYIMARHKIQLKDVSLVEVQAKNEFSIEDDNFDKKLALGIRVEIINDRESFGYLQAAVQYCKQDTDEVKVLVAVVYKGRFVSTEDIEMKELEEFTEIQCVPQLLPYIRTFMTTLSTMMFVPPIIIPTMDVIDSMKNNSVEE